MADQLVSLDRDAAVSHITRKGKSSESIKIVGAYLETVSAEGAAVYSGGVKAYWGDYVLTCDTLVHFLSSNSFYAEGAVVIEHPQLTLTCLRLWVNFEAETGYAEEVKVIQPLSPDMFLNTFLVLRSDFVSLLGPGDYYAEGNSISTCVFEPPDYAVYSPDVRYSAGSISAKRNVIKVGKFPVFYVPSLNLGGSGSGRAPVSVAFGRTSYLGLYLKVGLRVWRTEHFDYFANLGYFSARGYSLGSTTFYDYGKTQGRLRTFYIPDSNDGDYREKRYAFDYNHRTDFSLGSALDNLSLTAEAHRRSDLIVEKDFYRREWFAEKDPEDYINLQQTWDASSVSLLTRVRLNNYEATSVYTPEVRWNIYSYPWGGLRVKLDTATGYVNRTEVAPTAGMDDYRTRADAGVEYPLVFGNLATLVPEVGVRYRMYGNPEPGNHRTNEQVYARASLYSRLAGSPWLSSGGDRGVRHVVLAGVDFNVASTPSANPGTVDLFDEFDPMYEDISVKLFLTNVIEEKKRKGTGYEYFDLLMIRLENKIYSPCQERDLLNYGRTEGPLSGIWRLRLSQSFYFLGDFDYDWHEGWFATTGNKAGWNITPFLSLEGSVRFVKRNPFFGGNETTDVTSVVHFDASEKWYYDFGFSRLSTPGYATHNDYFTTIYRRGHDFISAVTLGDSDGKFYFEIAVYPKFAMPDRLPEQTYSTHTLVRPDLFR